MKLSINPLRNTEAIEVAVEEVVVDDNLFDIEIGTDIPQDKVAVELASDGSLVSLETLDKEYEDVSVEELIIGEAFEPTNAMPGIVPAQKMPRMLFIKGESRADAYLHGNCTETLDTLIHVLGHASEELACNISYCSPHFNTYEIMELIGAIVSTKAKIHINLISVTSPIDLLLLKVSTDINLGQGFVVKPYKSMHHGSSRNMEITLKAEKDYLELVYTELEENGILTKEEISQLADKNDIIFLSGKTITTRLKI